MINKGTIRVASAIVVPSISANRWEYVSGGLADWLFEFIQKFFLFLSLVVPRSQREYRSYSSYFSQLKSCADKIFIRFGNWHIVFLYMTGLLQIKVQKPKSFLKQIISLLNAVDFNQN